MVKFEVGDTVSLVRAGALNGRDPIRHARQGDRGVVIGYYEDNGNGYVQVKFDHGYTSLNWMAGRFEKADGPW